MTDWLYVAFKPHCGHAWFVRRIEWNSDDEVEVMRWLRNGYAVRMMTNDEFQRKHAATFICDCEVAHD